MPKVAIDYNNTIIYKIVCNDLTITECYVGHTTNFTKRKCEHKKCCNNISIDYYIYQFIRNNGGWDNWSMIEIEKYSCNDRNEALKRERYWIEELNSTLNKKIPTRTKKEYREINKDKMKEKQKQYNEINKEQLLNYQKEYREQNKDKIKEYQKKYREQQNADKIKDYQKNYFQQNADKIKTYQKTYREQHKKDCNK